MRNCCFCIELICMLEKLPMSVEVRNGVYVRVVVVVRVFVSY